MGGRCVGSVGVEPELDAVGVVQADEDGAAVVAGDDAAVLLADGGQVLGPGVHAVPGRDAERDEVEAGEGGGPFGVVPERDRGGCRPGP